jgi:SulP family sulfate permease
VKDDLLPIRLGLREWLGALGDIGTFVPIFLSLVALNGLPLSRSLVLVGLIYICTALYFRIPLPVQPLKAMATIAIAGGLGMPMIMAAGLWMGIILLLLAFTGRIEWLTQFFSRPIVKGIQLGVGLMLIKASLNLITMSSYPEDPGVRESLDQLPPLSVILPSLWILVLPQLPLTLGNAVFAVSDVAGDYFGDKSRRASPRNLASSIGLANLAIGVVGGLPVCHGSGGLTAHYRFGARTGGATLIMGVLYITLAIAIFFSGDLFLRFIPPWLIGLMLLYVGICHALLVRGLMEQVWLALSMGIIALLTGNLLYSLVFGLLAERLVPPVGMRRA